MKPLTHGDQTTSHQGTHLNLALTHILKSYHIIIIANNSEMFYTITLEVTAIKRKPIEN